jgi:antitoxin ParD1/3/4
MTVSYLMASFMRKDGIVRKSKPITVTLGKQQRGVDRRLASGLYDSASEVIRAAVRALDREEAAIDEVMRQKIRASLADPRADIPSEDVFARLRAYHEGQLKADPDDA